MNGAGSRSEFRLAVTALNAAGTPEELDRLLNLDDVEARARAFVPEVVYNFNSGGAADEFTVRWNRERFADLRLRQRVMQDLAGLDATTTLFGQRMPMPVLLAPTAGHRYTHPEGEPATARGAGAVGATMVLSTGTHTSSRTSWRSRGRPSGFSSTC